MIYLWFIVENGCLIWGCRIREWWCWYFNGLYEWVGRWFDIVVVEWCVCGILFVW